ncbi:MAG: VOC family protein, partial [Patescibacteria group bacterium]|nr:VOC family protein [Patescibacteria group bacterium]
EGAKVSGMPKDSVMTVAFELGGLEFIALNGGPEFKFSPAVSFFVNCKTKEEVDKLWTKLSEDGAVLMKLDKYLFSEKYGWVQDKFGVSWQLMFSGNGDVKQKITPTLMFVQEVAGKAEEAIDFYTSVFYNSKVGDISRYDKGDEPNKEGAIKHASFTLEGQEFMAMDSYLEHNFTFNESISFVVNCKTQQEIDYYWGKLSFVPESEQCGWLKDKYGLSWQIVPTILDEMLQDEDNERSKRVMQAMLQMKKIDIEALKNAYEGNNISNYSYG